MPRFADLKNDFVFRMIFAEHPELTKALLNQLLSLQGDDVIESLTIIPAEQAPVVIGAKLSILDVRCRDIKGRTFVAEMQLLHIEGFLNRVVYNACKAYVSQLPAGRAYSELAPVVALSICDFVIWPDSEQDKLGLPRIPMLSRWRISEQQSGTVDLSQVQYAFLELGKIPAPLTWAPPPNDPAARWAWLFRIGEWEGEFPNDASDAEHKVLELANRSSFTQAQADAYDKVKDEIWQAMQLQKDARAEGKAEGKLEGKIEGQTEQLATLFAKRLKRPLTEQEQRTLTARIQKEGPDVASDAVLELSAEQLEQWLASTLGLSLSFRFRVRSPITQQACWGVVREQKRRAMASAPHKRPAGLEKYCHHSVPFFGESRDTNAPSRFTCLFFLTFAPFCIPSNNRSCALRFVQGCNVF